MRGSDIGNDAVNLSDVDVLVRVKPIHSIILFLILLVKYHLIFLADLGLAAALLTLLQHGVAGVA